MNIENVLKVLKTKRRVDNDWMEKLEKVGLEICYGTYSYQDNQEYVLIGTHRVWMVKEFYKGNSTGITFRLRNDVVEEIIESLEIQYEEIVKEEEMESKMFNMINERGVI